MTKYTELVMVRHAQVEYTPNDKERALSKEGKELNHYDKNYDYTFWNNLKMPAIISIKLDEHGVVNSIDETKIQNNETALEHLKKTE